VIYDERFEQTHDAFDIRQSFGARLEFEPTPAPAFPSAPILARGAPTPNSPRAHTESRAQKHAHARPPPSTAHHASVTRDDDDESSSSKVAFGNAAAARRATARIARAPQCAIRAIRHTHLNATNSGSLRIFSHAPMPCFCTARRSARSSLASQYPRTAPTPTPRDAVSVAMTPCVRPCVRARVREIPARRRVCSACVVRRARARVTTTTDDDDDDDAWGDARDAAVDAACDRTRRSLDRSHASIDRTLDRSHASIARSHPSIDRTVDRSVKMVR
jgi:hypothetical protein